MPTRFNVFSLAPVAATVMPITPTTAVPCTPRNTLGSLWYMGQYRGMRTGNGEMVQGSGVQGKGRGGGQGRAVQEAGHDGRYREAEGR